MPDSPSIPATGWNGLPKRKARPLLHVTKDRFRPASSADWATLPKSTFPKQRLALLATVLVVIITLVVLLSLSVNPLDHVQHDEYQQPPAWPDAQEVLFQDEELDRDGDALSDEDFPANSHDGLAPYADQPTRLPFSCSASKPNGTSVATKYAKYPGLLKRSLLHAGSSEDLIRVMRRAAGLSQSWASTGKASGASDAFRVMVIGGSVSNCRGVDRSLCWHSHVMRWLSSTFPLGDERDSSQVSYRFIDLAKSATGSTFFSYCWHSELVIRKKHTPHLWGEGPDLVIIETGINDVVSPSDFIDKKTSQSYQSDFESLLVHMKSLPSRPAVVVLEAPSRLLQNIQGFQKAPEFTTHLAPSVWLDVPVISGKTALFTPKAKVETGNIEELYLADGHHPNAKGHELLADMLIAHLEDLACQIDEKAGLSPADSVETTQKLSKPHVPSILATSPRGQCIQFGSSGEKRKPKKNRGWNRLATSRDKQYMASSSPGSRLSYDVIVGEGGQILLSWLNSRFYNLGEARVILDGQRPGLKISGHWNLGWSIGVPTVLFEDIPAGTHTVTIEHVKPKAKDPATLAAGSNFRLIALATT